MEQARGALVTASAGFFVLGDKAPTLPRQASLLLAITNGQIVSLPVADREAVLSRDGTLSVAYIRAEGRLAIDEAHLSAGVAEGIRRWSCKGCWIEPSLCGLRS